MFPAWFLIVIKIINMESKKNYVVEFVCTSPDFPHQKPKNLSCPNAEDYENLVKFSSCISDHCFSEENDDIIKSPAFNKASSYGNKIKCNENSSRNNMKTVKIKTVSNGVCDSNNVEIPIASAKINSKICFSNENKNKKEGSKLRIVFRFILDLFRKNKTGAKCESKTLKNVDVNTKIDIFTENISNAIIPENKRSVTITYSDDMKDSNACKDIYKVCPNGFNSVQNSCINARSSVYNSLSKNAKLGNKLRQSSPSHVDSFISSICKRENSNESTETNTELKNISKAHKEKIKTDGSNEFMSANSFLLSESGETTMYTCMIDPYSDADFTDIVKTYSSPTVRKDDLKKSDNFHMMESSYLSNKSNPDQFNVSEIIDYNTFVNDIQLVHSSSRIMDYVENIIIDCTSNKDVYDLSIKSNITDFFDNLANRVPELKNEMHYFGTEAFSCNKSSDEIIQYIATTSNLKTVTKVADKDRSSLCVCFPIPSPNRSFYYTPFLRKKSHGKNKPPKSDTTEKEIAFILKTSTSCTWPSVSNLIKYFEKLSAN